MTLCELQKIFVGYRKSSTFATKNYGMESPFNKLRPA
jgi:hypothetical protein